MRFGVSDRAATVALVILTANDPEGLTNLLGTIESQSVKPDELIIVDNSDDPDREGWEDEVTEVIYISPGKFSFGTARDRAVATATSEIIVFLSGDAVPRDDQWLSKITEPFQDASVGAVQGVEDQYHKSLFWEGPAARGFHFTAEHRRWVKEYGLGFSLTCAAVRRTIMLESPLGNVLVGDDKRLQKTIASSGWKIRIANDAVVLHDHRYTWRTLRNRLHQSAFAMRLAGSSYSKSDRIVDTVIGAGLLLLFTPYLTMRAFRKIGDRRVRFAEWVYPLRRPGAIYQGFQLPQREIESLMNSVGRKRVR